MGLEFISDQVILNYMWMCMWAGVILGLVMFLFEEFTPMYKYDIANYLFNTVFIGFIISLCVSAIGCYYAISKYGFFGRYHGNSSTVIEMVGLWYLTFFAASSITFFVVYQLYECLDDYITAKP